jgi:hypothetical protein
MSRLDNEKSRKRENLQAFTEPIAGAIWCPGTATQIEKTGVVLVGYNF